jgi:membrane protein DedA with SNARE-associated domain
LSKQTGPARGKISLNCGLDVIRTAQRRQRAFPFIRVHQHKSAILAIFWQSEMHLVLLASQYWLAKAGSFLGDVAAKLGGPGVMLLAVSDSSFLSFPEGNDVLIVVLSSGSSWGRMIYYVGMTILGSIMGCLLLYLAGSKGGSPLLRRRFSEQNVARAQRLFEKYGLLTVTVPSILPPPTPFKIFVLSAGVFRLNLAKFLTAVAVGRTIRYFIWGILAVVYGNSVKVYMQNNLNKVGMILFGCFALLAAGILVYYLVRAFGRTRKMI